MDYLVQREVFEAIKRDDLSAFSRYSGERIGTFRMGRFPILSIIYLYNAKNIARAYESAFIKYNNWTELPELSELPSKFSSVAGKCLRLYFYEVVTPIEMLLILGKNDKVKAHYALTNVSIAQKNRLQNIYQLKYSLPITFSGSEIIIPRPPLTYSAKKRLITSIISAVLSVAIIICTPFVINVFYPFIGVNNSRNNQSEEADDDVPDIPDVPTDEPKTYEVSEVGEVDFSSKNTYVLLSDMTLPADYGVEQVLCSIDGNGKTVTFTPGEQIFKEFYGTLKDVTFRGSGDIIVADDYAFIIGDNYGEVNNVTVEYSGKITVQGRSDSVSTRIAAVAVKNSYTTGAVGTTQYIGTVDGATVNLNVEITGVRSADASFAGVVSNNESTVQNCTVNGTISSDTCDVAGIAADNSYYLYKNTNRANITQTTAEQQWSPLCAGIVLRNTVGRFISTVSECVNYGNITSTSTYNGEEAFESDHSFAQANGAGVVANNKGGKILSCVNNGEISVVTNECIAYSGGICATSVVNNNTPYITSCTNNGVVSVLNTEITALSAGVCAYAQNNSISDCHNTASVTQAVEGCTFTNAYSVIGGVVANGNGSAISSSDNTGSISANNVVYSTYAGGIAGVSSQMQGCSNSGQVDVNATSDLLYVGGVVGLLNGNASLLKNEGSVVSLDNSGTSYVGGIIGSTPYSISYCLSTGDITSTGKTIYAGGMIGKTDIMENQTYVGIYVYCGSVTNGIFNAALTVTATEEGYVGGVCGDVVERTYNEGEQNEKLFGASIAKTFILGTVNANSGCLIGTVSGVVGKKIYDANPDSLTPNFEKVYYSATGAAFGATLDGETLSPDPSDLDATSKVTADDIANDETYKAILNSFGS